MPWAAPPCFQTLQGWTGHQNASRTSLLRVARRQVGAPRYPRPSVVETSIILFSCFFFASTVSLEVHLTTAWPQAKGADWCVLACTLPYVVLLVWAAHATHSDAHFPSQQTTTTGLHNGRTAVTYQRELTCTRGDLTTLTPKDKYLPRFYFAPTPKTPRCIPHVRMYTSEIPPARRSFFSSFRCQIVSNFLPCAPRRDEGLHPKAGG